MARVHTSAGADSAEIADILSSPTDPIARFLRDLSLRPSDSLFKSFLSQLGENVPRKSRGKYGKRKALSESARLELSRGRNKEHARSTRKRRRIFEAVLGQQIRAIQDNVTRLVAKSPSPGDRIHALQQLFDSLMIQKEGDFFSAPAPSLYASISVAWPGKSAAPAGHASDMMQLVFRSLSIQLRLLEYAGELQELRLHFGCVEANMGAAVTCCYRISATVDQAVLSVYIPGSFAVVTLEGARGEERAATAVVFLDVAVAAEQITELTVLDYEEIQTV